MPCFFFILLAAINLKIFFLLKLLNFYTVKILFQFLFLPLNFYRFKYKCHLRNWEYNFDAQIGFI